MNPPSRLPIAVALAVGCASGLYLPACYSYAYHRRSGLPPHDRIAIDRNAPEEDVRWSYFWGLMRSEWTPPPRCEGKGAGRVEVSFVWYSVILMTITLGTVVPSKIKIYCTVDSAPSMGP